MHTIIFALCTFFFLQRRERHLNFILTDLIKPALLVVYAKICKHNNKETLKMWLSHAFKIKLMLFQAQMSFLEISKGNYYVTI